MADQEVKFTEDEMTELKGLQQGYLAIQNAWGQVGVQNLRLEQQSDALSQTESQLKNQYVDTQQKERTFVDTINKKYGDGSLDITTGVFTPKPAEPTEKTL